MGKKVKHPKYKQRLCLGGREEQQDSLFSEVSADGRLAFFVVCDGAGGHKGGAEASRAVTEYAGELWRYALAADREGVMFSGGDFMRHFFENANERVIEVGEEFEGDSHAALVALLRWDGYLHWGHVGDSRLYLFEEGKLLYRTKDHTIGQSMVDGGLLGADELAGHPDGSRLTRALGSESECKPSFGRREDDPGRCVHLVLCSDGFWGPLERAGTEIRVPSIPSLSAWVRKKSKMALLAGGERTDNLSVILIQAGEPRWRLNRIAWMFFAICFLSGMIAGMLWALVEGRY
jgi:serine/threonine protein phosphatase PrpC